MQIFVKLLTGKTITLEVERKSLKSMTDQSRMGEGRIKGVRPARYPALRRRTMSFKEFSFIWVMPETLALWDSALATPLAKLDGCVAGWLDKRPLWVVYNPVTRRGMVTQQALSPDTLQRYLRQFAFGDNVILFHIFKHSQHQLDPHAWTFHEIHSIEAPEAADVAFVRFCDKAKEVAFAWSSWEAVEWDTLWMHPLLETWTCARDNGDSDNDTHLNAPLLWNDVMWTQSADTRTPSVCPWAHLVGRLDSTEGCTEGAAEASVFQRQWRRYKTTLQGLLPGAGAQALADLTGSMEHLHLLFKCVDEGSLKERVPGVLEEIEKVRRRGRGDPDSETGVNPPTGP